MKGLTGEYRGFIVTPEKAVKFTKATVYLTCIWHPQPHSKKKYFVLHNIFLYSSIFFSITLLFPLIISIQTFSDNIFIVIKSSILISGIVNFLVKVIAVIVYREKIQEFDQRLQSFMKSATHSERDYLQKYVNKSWKFHAYMTCSYYLTTTGVLIGPLILPQKFPCDAVYPFPVDHPVVACLVYIHQCIVGFQCSAGMALDCQAALFLWYLGARCEILASEVNHINNPKELRCFIKKHQDIFLNAKDIIYPIKIITLTTIIMTRIGMIFGAIMLISVKLLYKSRRQYKAIGDQSLVIKIQFLILAVSATVNIFVCVWAADNLIMVSSRLLSKKIFETCCYQPPSMRKTWCFVIQRTQKPIVIKVAGFFNALSYEFYCSFLSTAFSYFTALNVLVN